MYRRHQTELFFCVFARSLYVMRCACNSLRNLDNFILHEIHILQNYNYMVKLQPFFGRRHLERILGFFLRQFDEINGLLQMVYAYERSLFVHSFVCLQIGCMPKRLIAHCLRIWAFVIVNSFVFF